MKPLFLGSFLAAVAAFLLGAIYWMNPLPTRASFGQITDEAALTGALRQNLPAPGAYLVPQPIQDQEAWTEKANTGPIALLQVIPGGQPSMGTTMGLGFLSQWITAFLLALLMRSSLGSLPTYADRVKFATLIGLVATFFITSGNRIWWYQGLVFSLFTGVYHILNFLVCGAVLAKFIAPARSQPS